MNPQDFISDSANNLAESLNEQIMLAAIDIINDTINLDKIIQDDKDKRLAEYNEAYESCKDDDIRAAMQYTEFSFANTQEKFKYAFAALIEKGYTFTHDVNHAWIVSIKIFKLESTKLFQLKSNFTTSIDPIS